MSLGALVNSLVLTEDERPASAILAHPSAGRHRVFASPLLAVWATQLQEGGIPQEYVEAGFAPVERRLSARIAPERILLQDGGTIWSPSPKRSRNFASAWEDQRSAGTGTAIHRFSWRVAG